MARHLGEGVRVSGILGHAGLLLAGSLGGSFYAQMMAQGPIHYWRNAESSGSVMVNEVAANGAYFGSPTLGNAALYTGGLTTVGGNFSSTNFGYSSIVPTTLPAMTIIGIVRPTNLTGFKVMGICRDDGSTFRRFQWRSNGAAMEFVRIPGSTVTLSQAGMLAINTTYLLAFEVDSAGNYAMYRNGVSVKTGNIGATDYGGGGGSGTANSPWNIGYAAGAATVLTGTTCENAVFNKVLGPTVQAALFAASGI